MKKCPITEEIPIQLPIIQNISLCNLILTIFASVTVYEILIFFFKQIVNDEILVIEQVYPGLVIRLNLHHAIHSNEESSVTK